MAFKSNVHEIARSVLVGIVLTDTDRELLEHRIRVQIRAAEKRSLRRKEIRTTSGAITPLQEQYLLLIASVEGATLKYIHERKHGEEDRWIAKSQSAVDRLCAAGLLEVTQVRIADGRSANFYRVNEKGQLQLKKIRAVKAALEEA